MNLFWKVEPELPASGREELRGQSGSRSALSLKPNWGVPEINSIEAIRALVQRGKPLLAAKRAIEQAMEQGEATVVVESHDFSDLIRHLAVCGFITSATEEV